MTPTIQISGMHALMFLLMTVALFGSLHLVAASHPSATLSRAWIGLGF